METQFLSKYRVYLGEMICFDGVEVTVNERILTTHRV